MNSDNFQCEKHDNRIYLDHNGTTPMASLLKSKIPEWLEHWGNASSIHQTGRGPKAILREAKKSVSNLIGAHELEIVFTSGGSEANNMVIQGVFNAIKTGKKIQVEDAIRNEYIYSTVEHPSVVKTMEFLERLGAVVHKVPVNRDGELDIKAYESLLSDKTALVSIMYANNETGNVFPIKKLAQIAHDKGALFHCDAVQVLGKCSFDIKDWGVDYASFSAHKFYALKGCGVMYSRKGNTFESLIQGGAQERSRRAGTENTLAIAAFGEMAKQKDLISQYYEKMQVQRDTMEKKILETISDVTITGVESKRIPNTSSFVISGVSGESLLMNLDIGGVSISTGAACSSGSPEPSPVLRAMGLTHDEAQSSLRVSLGWGTTHEEISQFIEILASTIERLRS